MVDRARARSGAQRRRRAESAPGSLIPRRVALGAVPLSLAAGAVAARAWLQHAPPAQARDLTQALPVVTAWGGYGAASFAILAASIGLATLGLVVGLRAARTCEPPGGAAILVATALSLCASLAWPFVFSSDVYAYAAYGDMAGRGLDPYRLVPAGVHDALIDAARLQWGGTFPVCVYGPVFVAFARFAAGTGAGHGVAATLFGLRAAGCATFLASVALLQAALADVPGRRRFIAACAYSLNPMLIWSAAEGHNDVYVSLAACAAAMLLRRGRALGAVFLLALTPLVKASGAILALAAACETALVARSPDARALPVLAAATAIALGVALPPLLPALATVGARGHYEPASLQALIGPWPAVAAASAAAAYAVRELAARRRRGFAWLGIAAVIALPNVYPWYGLWLAPLALAAGGGWAAAALWAATICAVLRYLPDATGQLTGASRFAAALGALPVAFALAQFVRRRKEEPFLP